jgi:hypothetical protein
MFLVVRKYDDEWDKNTHVAQNVNAWYKLYYFLYIYFYYISGKLFKYISLHSHASTIYIVKLKTSKSMNILHILLLIWKRIKNAAKDKKCKIWSE